MVQPEWWQNNAAAMDGLFSTYYVFHKTLLDYLKVYHQISAKTEMEQALMSLTSGIIPYDLPGLNFKYKRNHRAGG